MIFRCQDVSANKNRRIKPDSPVILALNIPRVDIFRPDVLRPIKHNIGRLERLSPSPRIGTGDDLLVAVTLHVGNENAFISSCAVFYFFQRFDCPAKVVHWTRVDNAGIKIIVGAPTSRKAKPVRRSSMSFLDSLSQRLSGFYIPRFDWLS